MKKGLPPRVALVLTILVWGCSFVASKAALREVSPVTLVLVRFAFGTALLLGLVVWRGENPLPPRETWPALALMGFVGVFVHHITQAFGLTVTTAVHAGWLIGLIPIWSALLSALVLKERFGAAKIVGLIGGFAGALLVITRGKLTADTLRLPATRGDFLIFLSTFNWAVYSILGHGTIRRLGPARATAGAMLFGWLMLWPLFVFQRGWRELPNLSEGGWGAILFLGLGSSGLGYLFWYSALERLEVSRVAAFLFAQPLVTLLAAVILLDEPVNVTTVLGGVLVLASVFVVQHAPGEPKRSDGVS